MNSYELSRKWFNYCFENPEKIKPNHSALYFFAIEHCNRLGWKDKFGFPSQMVMEALGIRNWKTYSKTLYDLQDFGFINIIEKSKNQYSSNIIALVKNTKAHTKALDKALSKHVPKQGTKQGQSIVSIIKQYNKEQLNYIKGVIEEELIKFKHIKNTYSKKQFLKDWNDTRTEVLNKPSHLNRLDFESNTLLDEIIKDVENISVEMKNALKGFFKQETFPDGQDYTTNVKHFLKHYSKYSQAYYDKNSNVYGK